MTASAWSVRRIGATSLSLGLAVGLSLGAAGCSDSGGGGSSSASTVAPSTSASGGAGSGGAGSAGQVPITPTLTQGRWFKGDLHSHSAPYSADAQRQGGDPPGTCFYLAEHVGLDFLALTDHRTMDQVNDPTYRANTLTILDGEEWGGTVHMGMVGLQQQVPEINGGLGASTLNAQVQAAYDDAHRQGGAVIANHPCLDSKVHIWLARDFDAVEVWNGYWNFPRGWKDSTQQDVDDKLSNEGLSAIGEDANPEIRAALAVRGGGSTHQALKFWEAHLDQGRKKAIVGGGDRHSIVFPGLPTTRVHAAGNSQAEIVAGIRQARTWVGAFEGPEVDFTADADGDGVFEAIIGDSVPVGRAVTYRLRVQNAQDGRVDVVKNGRTVLQFAVLTGDDTFTWTDTAASRSWTRVDVFERCDFSAPNSSGFQLLALSGAIFGQSGAQGLTTIAAPLGFQISIGTRFPTIRLPHEYDKILNFDRMNWGYSRGAITSPIWAE